MAALPEKNPPEATGGLGILFHARNDSDDPTTESQRLVFDEIAGSADLLVSYAIGLHEAARRGDRVRVHSYLGDVVKCVTDARGAYGRIADLAKLRGQQ
jgi:hypothetical protein